MSVRRSADEQRGLPDPLQHASNSRLSPSHLHPLLADVSALHGADVGSTPDEGNRPSGSTWQPMAQRSTL
ncbi:hypothetical protein M5W98_28680 [Paenibacillus apiarius]|nr:hypothetical protein [Paenibacillus apiarius]